MKEVFLVLINFIKDKRLRGKGYSKNCYFHQTKNHFIISEEKAKIKRSEYFSNAD